MIILGLGGNLGVVEANLRAAIAMISEQLLDNVRESSIVSTPALMPEGAPVEWDLDFLNMAVAGDLKRAMQPLELLAEIKRIETELGRVKADRWAPRVIDIDVLAWGDELVEMHELKIPHMGLEHREFAYAPFLELAPDWVHPRLGLKLADLVAK